MHGLLDGSRAAAPRDSETRQKFRKMLREGQLDDREIEIDLRAIPPGVEIMAPPGMEEMQEQLHEHVRQPRRRSRRSRAR